MTDVLYTLDMLIAQAHEVERSLREYEIDGVLRKLGRVRCRTCRRTLVFSLGSEDPTLPEVEQRTFEQAMRLHTCGCSSVHLTDE